jgi:SAM-dependent methyltransferase
VATNPQLSERERAEMARSTSEARHTPDAHLRSSEKHLARYLDPPRDTPFPLEFMFALVGRIAGQMVLDLGCGSGDKSFYLARRGARVVGVDLSHDLIALARRRVAMFGLDGQARFVVGSAHHLPVADETIDLLFGYAVLHHLDLSLARSEVYRVLKPGGRAVFHEPVRNSRLYRAVRRLVPVRQADVSPYEHPLHDPDIDDLAAPFRRGEARAFALPHVRVAHAVPGLRHHLTPIYRVDRRLLRTFPPLRHYAAVRVFELLK